MIRFPFSWPSKSRTETPVTLQVTLNPVPVMDALALRQAFVEGMCFALSDHSQSFRKALYDQALNEAVQRMTSSVEERARAAGAANPKGLLDLQRKQQEFRSKRDQAVGLDRQKYDHYLEALEWALHANSVPTHQS